MRIHSIQLFPEASGAGDRLFPLMDAYFQI